MCLIQVPKLLINAWQMARNWLPAIQLLSKEVTVALQTAQEGEQEQSFPSQPPNAYYKFWKNVFYYMYGVLYTRIHL